MTGAFESDWEIWLSDPSGLRLAELTQVGAFSLARVSDAVGAFEIELPGHVFDDFIRIDGIVEFWRTPAGGRSSLLLAGFIRQPRYLQDRNGRDMTVLSGEDSMELLTRRIVAYAAGSSQAQKTDYADDMMKAIIRENFGSSAPADRDVSGLNFTVAPDLSLAPSITKAFAWKNTFAVLKDIAAASAENGTNLYFDLVPIISGEQVGFDFRTYIDQRGIDRTSTGIIFGPEWSNLEDPDLLEDYEGEINYVYSGGQGEESDREIVEVSDTTRIGKSIWNRREAFTDARNEATTAAVTAKGETELNKGKPRIRFSGTLLDMPNSRFGVDWDFGDKVLAQYRGRELSGAVLAVSISVDGYGNEKVKGRLEIEQ